MQGEYRPTLGRALGQIVVRLTLALFFSVLLLVGVVCLLQLAIVRAQGDLTVEIGAAYNLVVDSNVRSPSTYAPAVATVMGRFCNESDVDTLTGVWGYIGDYKGGSGDTPGVYPARNSSTFTTEHPALLGTGIYSFTHVGGRIGLSDASRYVGNLGPGECKVQYWHFTYPRCENSEEPPCSGTPVWGDSVKPEDDLWLEFDIWTTANGGHSANTTRRMTMRNEISAMANKIEPNGNPGGAWFNTDSDSVKVGDIITSNGIRYEFGNVRHGFDNDGDFAPDYNAWAQPIGDPSFDPSCFRLIRTSGVLTVSRGAGKPDMIVPFVDQLYFMNLPPDNNGVVGNVYYTFLALDGPCDTALTPYQEVASGFDNEKFNGDYGAGIPPVGSEEPDVTVDKSGNITVTPGARITYTIGFANAGGGAAGLPLSGMPLVISDSVPAGTTFVGGSSGASLGVNVLYSTNGGQTWTTTLPASGVTHVQWWLTDTLGAGASGTITFAVQVTSTSPITPYITNCADARFGNGAAFDEDCFTTLISGTNRIGDWVWKDEDADGVQDTGEISIASITVWLYWDQDGDGELDDGDPLMQTTQTDSNGYYLFNNLPDAKYLAEVDGTDSDLPYGYNHTTASVYAVDLDSVHASSTPVSYLNADFGFGPVLRVDKKRASSVSVYEGDAVTYTIDLVNTRSGNGTGQASTCRYDVWAGHVNANGSGDIPESGIGNTAWVNPANARFVPDGVYAVADLGNNPQQLGLGGFELGPQSGSIISVEVVMLFQEQSVELQATDNMKVNLYVDNADVNGAAELAQYTGASSFTGSVGTTYVFTINVTSYITTWSHFSGDRAELYYVGDKGPGSSPGDIALDGVKFRITTDGQCGGADDTIGTLPLTDTYDANRLRFVSAVPPQNSTYTTTTPYANTGVISWTNLGPLYAGQTKVVTLTFTALEPTNNTTTTVTNTVAVTGAMYSNGRPVHSASDTVTNTILPTGSIGDYVWRDQDGEGDQDEGIGIPNVVISLTANVSITLAGGRQYGPGQVVTTTTDANGLYLFEGLRYTGRYTVTVSTSTLPTGGGVFTNTYDLITAFDAITNSRTSFDLTPTLAGGGNQLGADFGYQLPTVIEGAVWHDRDRSGTGAPDSGEEWLTNVVVTLTLPGGGTTTTTTDANGYFRFVGNYSGTYTVTVSTGTGDMSSGTWYQSFDTDGVATAHQVTVTVSTGGRGRADYSYYQTGNTAVGDTVYYDWDGNGSQQSNEEGIPDITVYLYEDSDGDGVIDVGVDALISTTVTADGTGVYPSGYYTFTNLPSDDYIVVVSTTDPDFPGSYYQTQDPDEDPGTCTTCDSRGKADTTSASVSDVDFGYKPTGSGSIGDTVWRDMNGDGAQAGPQETGIVSITVWLEVDLDGDGTYTRVATDTTDADGKYLFENLPDADYRVVVDDGDSDLPTDAFRYPYIPSTATAITTTISSINTSYLDADFGFKPLGAIGDTVYWDANRNGDLDWNETGIGGVVVTLTNLSAITTADGTYPAGTYVLTTTTNATGTYLFTGLVSGTYSVTVGSITGDPTLTGDPDTNGIPCTELNPGDFFYSFCDGQTNKNIRAGTVFLGADFGYVPPGVIGDYVWRDLDNDGVQDANDPGIAGVVVTVTNGIETYTTTTDIDGYYSFANLGTDTWAVTFQQPANMTPTVTSVNAITSGVGSVGLTTAVEINGSGDVTSIGGASCTTCSLYIDSGFVLSGSHYISGTVFFDSGGTGDGASDTFTSTGPYTDTPYANVTVYLYDASRKLIGTTSTDANGQYTFTNLINGVYTVSVDTAAPQLSGMDLTASVNPGYGYATVMINDNDWTDQDFGFYEAADFGDLPATYNATLLADEGPYHISGTLRLGSGITSEGDGHEDAFANGDSDDGVALDKADRWTPDAQVNLVITVTGGTGRLVGWFDWDNDGVFDDAGAFRDFGNLSGAQQVLTLTLPGTGVYTTSTPVNARFRLFDPSNLPGGSLDAGDYIGPATDGEVEDYQWTFGPTAIAVRSFVARPASGVGVVAPALILAFAALGAGVLILRRWVWRRT